jgi:DedD protein
MDHELKQRLIGAVVVTALCAIFIPMLFDDPVDNSGQLVSELSIPAPDESGSDTAGKLPMSADQVSNLPDPEPLSTEETASDSPECTGAEEEVAEPEAEAGHPKQGRSGESLYAESEGYAKEDAGAEEVIEPEVKKQPKSSPKPTPAAQPSSAKPENITPKVQVKDSHVDAIPKESAKIKKIAETAKPLTPPAPPTPPPVVKVDAAKAGAVTATVPKQPNTAKGLAAAIAEAKKPAVVPVPKETPKLVRWYIQIGIFSKKENATSLWDSLREQGLPASLDTVQIGKETSYRLRVGPELDGKKAAAMKARLDKQNINAILISE